MEVSGRKHAKETKSSIGDVHLYCEPCDAEGERINAGGYCRQCREYLCTPCIKFHRRGTLGKLHDVMEGDAMPTTRSLSGDDDSTLNEICPIHSEPKELLKFYCPTHDEIGCGDCIVLTHRTCKVDSIMDASKGFKDSREFKDILTSIANLEQRIRDCDDTIKVTSKSNTEVKQAALKSIRNFRAEILAYFDKREQELMSEIETMKAEDDKLLADVSTQREDSKIRLEGIKREIENNQKEAKKLFISAKQRKSELAMLNNRLADSTKHVKSRRRDYMFNRDVAIEDILTSGRPLGTLDNCTVSTTLTQDFSKARCIPSNDINIRTSEDKSVCDITGMRLLIPDVLVLADLNNNAVKVVDTTSKKVKSRLQLSSKPLDLTILPDKQIAVTMVDEQKIQILAVHNNKLSKHREFKVSGQCFGIDYKLGKLAVIYLRPAKVEIMDITGLVIRAINSNKTNKIRGSDGYVMFTSTGQELLVTCNDYSVKKLSLQGDVLASYSDADLLYPCGIAVTGAGGVLACGYGSHTVHVEYDKKLKTLLTSQDGLYHPQSVCVSEDTGMLYVGDEGQDVLKTFKLRQ